MDSLYLLVVVDRHREPYAELFDSLKSALDYVFDCVLSEDEKVFIDDEQMTPEELNEAGWVYHKRYSCEDDYVYIIKKEVKK